MRAKKFHLCIPDDGELAKFDTKAEAFAEGRRRKLPRFWVHDGKFCLDEFEDADPRALEAAVRGGQWNNCD